LAAPNWFSISRTTIGKDGADIIRSKTLSALGAIPVGVFRALISGTQCPRWNGGNERERMNAQGAVLGPDLFHGQSIDPLSTISPNKTYYSYGEIRNYISGGPTHWTHLLKFDQQSPATLVAVDTWMDDHCPRDETLYLQLKTRKKRRERTNHSVANPCDDFERKSICRWSLWFIFAGRFSIPLLFLEMNPASIYQQLTTTSSAKIIIVASIWRVHLAETLV
jgi:hypothetical protein